MTPYERKLRRELRRLARAGGIVSRFAWNTPIGPGDIYLEVDKSVMRQFDRALKKAQAVLSERN